MQALDELVARWRKNPDPESTLALCAHLGTAPEAELIREVASAAETWHRENHAVMLSVGRMHLDAGLLAEAQAALLQAGKLSPQDAVAYRYLGEVLLRRGDAVRAERALARALELGSGDDDTRLWHERAIVYGALQKRQGITAVADEVARTAPLPAPASSRPNPQPPGERDSAGGSRAARRSRPPPAGRVRPSVPKPSRRRGSTPPPADAGVERLQQDTLLMGRSPLPAPARPAPFPVRDAKPRAARPSAGAERAPVSSARAGATPAARRGEPPAPLSDLLREAESLARGVQATDTHPDADAAARDPFAGTFGDEHARVPPSVPGARAAFATPRGEPPTVGELARDEQPAPIVHTAPRAAEDDADLHPSPESVLLALARVGLYETDGGVVPAWEAAPRPSARRLRVMVGGLLAATILGIAGYRYAIGVQDERIAQAQELGMQLATALESGSRARLSASEDDFQRLFELDSRGREPAFLWLENRALHALIGRDPVSGIESALSRARTVGIEEQRLVFGRLASSLAAGDLPGAGSTIAEWDPRLGQDALYQLFSGAVFERAGNAAALERYALATRLQPDLQIAHLFAARLALLSQGPSDAKSTLEIACARLGSGPATDVLRGLEWASSPPAAGSPPALPATEAIRDLPAPLVDAAEAALAVRAHREGRVEEARAAFGRALGPSATPALADWIGRRALELGELDVARKAALTTADPTSPASRLLAVRIALAAGRLDAARSTAKSLEPSSRDAVLVEAISAYENLDGAAASRLVAGLPPEPGATTPEGLRQADAIVLGSARLNDERLQQLARSQQPWAGQLAVDVALDTGRIELAERLVQELRWAADGPQLAARVARLRRYQGQGAAALELAPVLIGREGASPRGITEAVLAFVDGDRPSAAQAALDDSDGAAGGAQPWLELIVEVARGRQANARKAAAALELPDKSRPALIQLVALRALAALEDKRGRAYHAQLERRFRGQPDVLIAARKLGLAKP
jgi:tetratricopeptide (TPR) repeat protein